MQNNILSLLEWNEYLSEFLLDEEKVTPFTESLAYIFTELKINITLPDYELNSIFNKNQYIDYIINYIDNYLLNITDYNYLSLVIKYFLEFWRIHDDLDDFINLESFLHEFQLNDFTLLINKYNEWLQNKNYSENIFYYEPIIVSDHVYLLENWIDWFHIRKRMNNVFINNYNVDWYIFSTYLNIY